MLRFIKHNLTGIDSVEIYPLISLLIFVLFFLGVLAYVIKMKKTRVNELGAMPFDETDEVETTKLNGL
jgi:cytochrome c oxidase cbb3-type subunit 4